MSPVYYPRPLLLECAAFTAQDRDQIARCRGSHNRLGFGYQLALVRLTGRFPPQTHIEVIDELLTVVASALAIEALKDYAQCQATVCAHQEQIRLYLQLKPFGPEESAGLGAFLLDEACRIEHTSALLARAETWLRQQRVLLPAPSTLRRLVGEHREQARQPIFERLMGQLSPALCERLDALLAVGEERLSPLALLKEPPAAPAPRSVLRLADRLRQIEHTGILVLDLAWLNNNLQKALARRARTSSAHRLRGLVPAHRYTVMVCFLWQTYRDTVDHLVEMQARLITDTHRRAQYELDDTLRAQRTSLRTTLAAFKTVGRTVLDNSLADTYVRSAVFEAISPEQLEAELAEAESWLSGNKSDAFPFVVQRFSYLRQFSPEWLERVTLEADTSADPRLLEAVALLREMNATGRRKLPPEAPLGFIPARLRRFVETPEGLDRKAYEWVVMTQLRDEIRRGNLWVRGSKRFVRLDDFFLPGAEWAAMRERFFQQSGLPLRAEEVKPYLTGRLDRAYDRFLSSLPDNAYVEVTPEGWQLSTDPAEPLTPDEEAALERLTEGLLARITPIRLPDLLIEVDNALDWTRHFLPAREREPRRAESVCQAIATVMAYGCNIGPQTMARLTNGVSYEDIQRIADWHLTEDNLKAALADIVNAIARLDTTHVWGEGKSSSSDGQRFLFPRKVLRRTYSHRLGDYALEFYTFVADNYAPFYSVPIECTERDAAYVLDGLLYHESDLDPEEHYTDTHGYTEINFAAFAAFGKRFCPRIRGLHHQWIYRIDPARDYGVLGRLVGRRDRTLHLDWIGEQWDRIHQFFASFAAGHTTASVALKRLVAFGPQNHFYRATRELGRVFKTEFILEYLSDPALRRRIQRGLLKGEQLHALARRVHYGKLGRADGRDFEQQMSTASCLVLILAAIVYWQIKEIDQVLATWNPEQAGLNLELLTHISPIQWENVLLYEEYTLDRSRVRRTPARRTAP